MANRSNEPSGYSKEKMLFLQDMFAEHSDTEHGLKELPYIVYQITLKEKLLGTGSRNLTELEEVLNHFFSKGYRLHSISTTTSTGGSMGFAGGDRIQATLVFEKIDLFK